MAFLNISVKEWSQLKFFKLARLLMLGAILLIGLQSQVTTGQTQERVLGYSFIEGSGSSKLRSILSNVQVQRLLLDISRAPRSKEYLESKLQGSQIEIKALLDLELIRHQEDLYVINILLFSQVFDIFQNLFFSLPVLNQPAPGLLASAYLLGNAHPLTD